MKALLEPLLTSTLMRRVLRNTGYLFSANGIAAGVAFVQSILVARLLEPRGLGILTGIIAFTSLINKFVSFRMGELVIKYVGQYNEANDRDRSAAVFKAAALAEMLASCAAFGLVLLLAPLAERYLIRIEGAAGWLAFYSLIILANLISESSTGLLQIFDRYRRMAGLNVVQSTFTLFAIGLVYVLDGGLPGVLLAYLGGKTIGALGLTAAALVEASRRWGRDWWKTPLSLLTLDRGELGRFAVSTNISASLSLINKDSEALWILYFRSLTVGSAVAEAEAGFYKVALGMINLVQMPVAPLPQATYPELSREVAHQNWSSVRQVLRHGSLLAGGFTLAAALALVLFGRPILAVLYTPAYMDAYPALVILLVGFLFANTFYWNRTALLALGRPDFPTKVNLVLAGFKIAGIVLLIPRYGYLASAALLAGSYILGVSVSALKVRSLIERAEALTPAPVKVI